MRRFDSARLQPHSTKRPSRAPSGGLPMKNGMVIIDADGHAVDDETVYRERLPERYRKRNFIVPSDGFDRNQNGTINKRPESSAQNLADNAQEDRRLVPVAG